MTHSEQLYNSLLNKGYTEKNIGDRDTFLTKMQDKENRRKLYDFISKRGDFRIGNYENYEKRIASDFSIPQPLQENIALAMAHPMAKVNPALRTQSAKPIGDVQASQNIGNKASLTFDDVQPMPPTSEVLQRNAETLAGLNAPSGLQKSPDNIQQAISQDIVGKAASQAWQRDTLNSISGMRENALKNLKARTEELRNSSEAFNDSQWLGSPSQYGYAPMTTPGVHAPNLHSDHEANMYRLTIDFLDDAEKHIETVRKNQARNGLRQAAAGVGDALFDIDTLTLGLDSLAKNFTLKAILEKADADQPLTQAEESLLNAALYKQFTEAALPNGRWYNIGKGIGENIPYMLQFGLSGLAAGALTKGATKAIGKQVVKYINNLALKNGSKIANKATRALGNGISKLSAGTLKALAQTPLQPSLYNDIVERQIGTLGYSPSASNSEANTPPLPEGIGEVSRSDGGVNSRGGLQYTGRIDADNTADAIRNGLASTFITNITEGIGGEGLQFIFNKIGGGALSGLGKGYTKLTGKQIQSPRFYNRFREAVSKRGLKPMLDAIGFNGAPSEFAEEVLDGLANALIVGDQSVSDVLDKDNLIDTAITTGVISLFMGAMGTALSAKVHHDVNKAFAQANHNLEELKYSNLEIQALNDIAIDNPQNTAKWVSSITRTMRTLATSLAEITNSLSPEARQYLEKKNRTDKEFNELSPYDQQGVIAHLQISNRFNELTIQRDYVVAGTNYNAMIQGLKERVAPQAEAELADIQANALRDSDYTVKVTFRGQDGYLVSGTADINDLPDGSTEATLPAGNIYQVRTKSPDGQWIIQQAVAEDITPGIVTPTQQLIDETTARIYTPVQNLINAEQAQAQAEVAQSYEQTTPTTEQPSASAETTPTDVKDSIDTKDSTVSTTTSPILEQPTPILEQASPILEQASPILDSSASSVIGRSLSADESQNLIAQMEQNAEVAPEVELTPENWINLFGEDGTVDTPIGSVKMGENQYLKLFKKNRAQYLGMIKPTLSNPDIVLEEYDPKDNAERESKYLFVKTFIKADGSRYVHFESVTVKKDNLEVSISSHEVNESALTKKVQQSKLLHLNSKFLNSDGRLIEPLNEGSDLVPTPNSVSDSNKSVSTDKDTTSSLNNNILDENVLSTLKEDIENLRAKADTIEYELDYLADILNDQLGYDFRDGIDLYKKTFIKLGSNQLKTLKWFRDNVSDNKEYPNLIFDFAKTLNQIVILESQLKRSDEQFDEHIATLPAGDAIQAITQRRGANEADQYAQWRKGILTKERDKAQKALNAKVKPFDASRYPDYAQMKREERKYNESIQATRSEALSNIERITAEIADIDRYLADRNRQIAAEREAENPLRNGIAQAVEKQPINTLEQYIARYIALGGRLRMTDQYTNGLAAELGITHGSQEHRELLSILSNTEGMTPEQLAQDMAENIEPEYRHLVAGRDVQDIRNAIIDTISGGVTSRRRAYNFIADINQRVADEEQRYIDEQELQAEIDADTEQAIREYEELLLPSLTPDDLAIIDTMAGDYWDELLAIQQYEQEAYNDYDTNSTSTTPRNTQQGAESTAIQSGSQPSNTTPIRQDSQDTATIRPATPQQNDNGTTIADNEREGEINKQASQAVADPDGINGSNAPTAPNGSTTDSYTITPTQYTTKRGNVLDMQLVKFANDLTKEQYRTAKELAKADKGWYDREQGGFMMRSQESAQQLADTIASQPISMTDIKALNDGDIAFTEPQQSSNAPTAPNGSTQSTEALKKNNEPRKHNTTNTRTDIVNNLQLTMSDKQFNDMLNNGNIDELQQYQKQLYDALRVEEGYPFYGHQQLRQRIKQALEQYGNEENLPIELKDSLLAEQNTYSKLSRSIYDRISAINDRIRQVETEQKNTRNKQEKEAKTQQQQTAYNGFLKDKSQLAASTADKALSKKYKFDGEVLSVAQYIEKAIEQGNCQLSTIQEPKYKGASNRAWNRMDARQQEEDARRVKENGTKTIYLVNGHDFGKTAYQYAQYLMELKTTTPANESLPGNIKDRFSFRELDEQTFSAPASDSAIGEVPQGEGVNELSTSPEEQAIIDRTKANGTYLLAPNGQPTNLTPRQWVQVRTRAFKEWFGDWEKQARVNKLRNSEPINIVFNDQYDLNRDSAKQWMRDNIRGEYTNKDTGETIQISRVGINEVTSHGTKDNAHLVSISAIPQLIENSIFIEEMPNEKENDKYDSYRYYVCGAKINGDDYTIKVVIGVKGDSKYYDHRLTQIEKGILIDNLNGLSNSVAENQNASYSMGKDSKLLSILQTNASKIVDENGEPMVATHYSPNKFTTFDTQKIGSTTDYDAFGKGFYFSPNMPEFRSFYGNERYDVYLNIKNPLILNDVEKIWQIRNDQRYADNLRFNSDKIQREGYDGTVYINEQNGKILNHELIAFSPNQIKSATDNIGTFDSNNPDIRFRSLHDTVRQLVANNMPRRIEERTVQLAVKLGVPITVLHSNDDLRGRGEGFDTLADWLDGYIDGRKHRMAGMFDAKSNQLFIFAHNIAQMADPIAELESTITHEVVAHYGLRQLLGDKGLATLLGDTWAAMPQDLQIRWGKYAMNLKRTDTLSPKEMALLYSDIEIQRKAAEEYIAHLSESGVTEPTLWQRICASFRRIMRKLGIFSYSPTETDIRYILSQSYSNLTNKSSDNQQSPATLNGSASTPNTRFRTFGGNSGYVGYSMSKRAEQAREEGRYPKTDFKKIYGITDKMLTALVESGIVSNNEWHHTSKFGNKTTFYGFENQGAIDFFNENKDRVKEAIKNGTVKDLLPEFEQAATAYEEEELRIFQEAQEKRKIENELRNKYKEYINSYIPDDYTTSKGLRVVKEGYTIAVYKDGERLTKRHGRVSRDTAIEEYNNHIKQIKANLPSFEEWQAAENKPTSFRSIRPDESLSDYARAVVANSKQTTATANDSLPGNIKYRFSFRELDDQTFSSPASDSAIGEVPQGEGVNELSTSPEEQDIIDQAKANGTYLLAPNGQPTNLTPRQWAQVRTEAFKRWFGDWELLGKKNFLTTHAPVSTLTGNEFARQQGITLTDQVEQYFATIGNKATSPIYGDVILDRRGADDSLAHGMSRNKAIAYAAVKDVIETGILIDYNTNHKGRGYDSAVIAAPIEIAGERYICYTTIIRNKKENRYYLHEVWTQKNLTDVRSNAAQKQPSQLQGTAKILQNILAASDNVSKIVDENGEPRVMYHGSNYRPLLADGTFKAFDGAFGKGIYFTSAFPEAADYAREKLDDYDLDEDEIYENGYVTEAFLNVRDSDNIEWSNYGHGEIITWAENPNQIKSATDNIGTFDNRFNDIRFRSIRPDESLSEYARAVVANSRQTPPPAGLNAPVGSRSQEDLELIDAATERFKEYFNTPEIIQVFSRAELRKLYGDMTDAEFNERFKEYKNIGAIYDADRDKIYTFVENSENTYVELIHEATHAAIQKLYNSENLKDKLSHFVNEIEKAYTNFCKGLATTYSGDDYINELTAYTIDNFLNDSSLDNLLNLLSPQAQQELLPILKAIGYEKGRKQQSKQYARIFTTRPKPRRYSETGSIYVSQTRKESLHSPTDVRDDAREPQEREVGVGSYYVCKRKARRDGWSRPLPQGAPRPMNFKREK